jgi:hypothetical protein
MQITFLLLFTRESIILNIAIFWDIEPFSPYANRRFGPNFRVESQPNRKPTCSRCPLLWEPQILKMYHLHFPLNNKSNNCTCQLWSLWRKTTGGVWGKKHVKRTFLSIYIYIKRKRSENDESGVMGRTIIRELPLFYLDRNVLFTCFFPQTPPVVWGKKHFYLKKEEARWEWWKWRNGQHHNSRASPNVKKARQYGRGKCLQRACDKCI